MGFCCPGFLIQVTHCRWFDMCLPWLLPLVSPEPGTLLCIGPPASRVPCGASQLPRYRPPTPSDLPCWRRCFLPRGGLSHSSVRRTNDGQIRCLKLVLKKACLCSRCGRHEWGQLRVCRPLAELTVRLCASCGLLTVWQGTTSLQPTVCRGHPSTPPVRPPLSGTVPVVRSVLRCHFIGPA